MRKIKDHYLLIVKLLMIIYLNCFFLQDEKYLNEGNNVQYSKRYLHPDIYFYVNC